MARGANRNYQPLPLNLKKEEQRGQTQKPLRQAAKAMMGDDAAYAPKPKATVGSDKGAVDNWPLRSNTLVARYRENAEIRAIKLGLPRDQRPLHEYQEKDVQDILQKLDNEGQRCVLLGHDPG